LSLNSKTKKVTVSSYTNTPVPSRPSSRVEDLPLLEEQRVPAPSSEVSYARQPADPNRPWRNVKAGELRYIAPPADPERTTGQSSRRRRKKEGAEQQAPVTT
ncbi:hypothetical protein HYDPIDRAFT_85644, partial [Hydnomerulius pinastri MD-312]